VESLQESIQPEEGGKRGSTKETEKKVNSFFLENA